MPRPRVATSCEVMPPLASTQAGGRVASATVSLTTAASAADTVRAMARRPAASRPVATARLVYSRTSDPGSAAAACRAVAAATRPARRSTAGTSSSMAATPGRARSTASWRLVWPTCEPTTIRPCPPSRPRPVTRGRAARSARRAAGAAGPGRQGADERRAGAQQERLAGPLGPQHPAGHRVQVGVVGAVHRHPAAAAHPGQHPGDPLRPAEPDVGQADAGHLVRPDRAAAAFRDEPG